MRMKVWSGPHSGKQTKAQEQIKEKECFFYVLSAPPRWSLCDGGLTCLSLGRCPTLRSTWTKSEICWTVRSNFSCSRPQTQQPIRKQHGKAPDWPSPHSSSWSDCGEAKAANHKTEHLPRPFSQLLSSSVKDEPVRARRQEPGPLREGMALQQATPTLRGRCSHAFLHFLSGLHRALRFQPRRGHGRHRRGKGQQTRGRHQ